jgi:hypothetical protein
MGTWVELVWQTSPVTFEGRARSLVEPFELNGPVTVGPSGCSITADAPGTPSFSLNPLEGGELEVLRDGGVVHRRAGKHISLTPAGAPLPLNVLRVVGSSPLGTCGLPAEVPAPRGPLDDAALQVFGDHLLEQGYQLGERLHARADPAEDARWLGPFTGSSVATWRCGVVERLRLGTATDSRAVCEAMRKIGIVRVMRHLELSGFVPDTTSFVETLAAQGGLTWLESLSVVVRPEYESGSALRMKRLRHALSAIVEVLPALQRPPNLSQGNGFSRYDW